MKAAFNKDPENPADVTEKVVLKYVTMNKHHRVVYVLWMLSTHVPWWKLFDKPPPGERMQ